MIRRTAAATAALAIVLTIAGCSSAAPNTDKPVDTPGVTAPGDAAGGSRLAAGLYDQPDGTVVALGTLEWSDLEGGFWAVIGGAEATGDQGTVVAVLAGVAKDDPTYVQAAGSTVEVTGKRLEGASIRMAGPEVTVTAIRMVTDTPGAAE